MVVIKYTSSLSPDNVSRRLNGLASRISYSYVNGILRVECDRNDFDEVKKVIRSKGGMSYVSHSEIQQY